MPRTIKTTLELGGESAYKKGLQSVDRALKAMSKELSEATSKFAENSASLKNVSSVSNAYKNSIEQQKVKVNSLKGAVETCNKKYEEAVKKYEEAAAANGENSAETLKAADALLRAEKSLDDYTSKLKSAEKYLESSQKKMKEFTDENNNIIALSESVEKVKDKISSLSAVQNVTKKFEELKTKAGGIAEKLEPVTSKIKKVESAISPVKGAFELVAKKAGAIKEKLEPAINVCKNVAKEAAKISFKAAETGAKAVSTSIDTAKKAFTAYTGALTAAGTAGFGLAASAGLAADDINTLSKQTGLSTEQIQKFQYASNLIDVDLETLTGSMAKLTKNMATAQGGTGSAAEAFSALGVSITNSNGELRNNQDVFNDAITALSGIENETQRDAYAMQIFGKSAQDLNPLILGGADALKPLGDSASNAGLIMEQDALDSLNSFNDSLDIIKANAGAAGKVLAGTFAGGFQKVTDKIGAGLPKLTAGFASLFDPKASASSAKQFTNQLSTFCTDIVNTVAQMLPTFITGFNNVIISVVTALTATLPTVINTILPTLLTGFNSLITGVITVLPDLIPTLLDGFVMLFSSLIDSVNLVIEQLMPMLPEIITQISTALIENLPTLLNGALNLFLGLIQALDQVIEQLMPMMPQLITDLCDTLIANIDEIITTGFDLLVGLIDGITECIPTLLAKLPEIIDKLVSTLTNSENLSKLIDSGVDLIVALAEGLPKAIPDILLAIPEIIAAIINALMEQDWVQVGIDILRGIADGLIAGVDAIGSKIESAGEAIKNKFKDFFGIASPSKLFKKEVGVYLAQGIGVGFEDEMDKVTKQMQKAVPSDFSTVVNADVNSFAARPATSTVTKNSNMTVNYIFENVTINNDKDIEENAYKLEFMRRKAALAMGGI